MNLTQAKDLKGAAADTMETLETVHRFFERAPHFTQLAKALAEFSRNDFHQPLEPGNFLAFVERDAGELDEEGILAYCRMHLSFAGLWNLGLELEVRSCWRMACMLDHWRGLIQGNPSPAVAG